MLNIHHIMRSLARLRPIFHSEADFQHAFAWELQSQIPEVRIRLELPIQVEQTKMHLDIWARYGDITIAVELKYKTRGISLSLDGEYYRLANHGAQDLGRYDYIKDISRVETMSRHSFCTHGYAVLLTNDSAYWADSHNTVDTAFRLHQERVLSGNLPWHSNAGAGTIRGREKPIHLTGEYPIQWQDYSTVKTNRYNIFRYVCASL